MLDDPFDAGEVDERPRGQADSPKESATEERMHVIVTALGDHAARVQLRVSVMTPVLGRYLSRLHRAPNTGKIQLYECSEFAFSAGAFVFASFVCEAGAVAGGGRDGHLPRTRRLQRRALPERA